MKKMTFIKHAIANQYVKENLDIYKRYLDKHQKRYIENVGLTDEDGNLEEKGFVNRTSIFFRKFYFYFLDFDPIRFDTFMRETSEDFYFFFIKIMRSYPSRFHKIRNEKVTDFLFHADDVVVFFTRAYELHPDIFPLLLNLIRKLEPTKIYSKENDLWNDMVNYDYISPFRGKDLVSSWNNFFDKYFNEMNAFVNRMRKVSFHTWEDIFDSFRESFPDYHFLILMEMTDEYLNKIELMEKKRIDYVSEEEE